MSRNKKKIYIIVTVLISLILILAGILGYMIFLKNKNVEEMVPSIQEPEEEIVEDTGINIFSGNDRPIAVMIDNHKGAWPQAGLKKAYDMFKKYIK